MEAGNDKGGGERREGSGMWRWEKGMERRGAVRGQRDETRGRERRHEEKEEKEGEGKGKEGADRGARYRNADRPGVAPFSVPLELANVLLRVLQCKLRTLTNPDERTAVDPDVGYGRRVQHHGVRERAKLEGASIHPSLVVRHFLRVDCATIVNELAKYC